jgi:hypothetical protein
MIQRPPLKRIIDARANAGVIEHCEQNSLTEFFNRIDPKRTFPAAIKSSSKPYQFPVEPLPIMPEMQRVE